MEENDDDLDKLLDSALDDFTKLGLASSTRKGSEVEEKSAEDDTPSPSSILGLGLGMGLPPPGRVEKDNKRRQKTSPNTGPSHASEALEKLSQHTREAVMGLGTTTMGNENEQNQERMVEEFVKEFEQLSGSQDMESIVETMMQQLLSKEILHDPMKEIAEKYPKWLEEHRTTSHGKNDRRLDDCLRYCIVSGKKALENAGIGVGTPEMEKIDKVRAGVLVGTGMGGLTVFSDGVQNLIEKGYRKITPFFIPYAITNMGSALLAMDIGFMGANYSISTACATSNYCFYSAANHIRRGDVDIMLAGGTEAAIIPIGLGGFIACRALSQRNDDPETASRPWDKGRDGFVMGEGAGVLVMESLEHAMKRGAPIIAEYLGGAVNCDAHHMTDPRADGLGVSTCIKKSLEDAGVSPEEVNYINAHATSTIAGDLAEVNAIKQVFKNTSEIKINGTKSMIGHCLGASGGLEAIATVKAITTGWLHPTINQFDPEESVEFDTVANKKKQHEVNVAISNSFGFGGHNSVVVFAPFKP